MVQAIERYMKQAIVDRNPSVASAALVSAMVSTVNYNYCNDFAACEIFFPQHSLF